MESYIGISFLDFFENLHDASICGADSFVDTVFFQY